MSRKEWEKVEQILTQEAATFLYGAYGLKLQIPVKVNGRLKNFNGRFLHKRDKKESIRIEIAKNYIIHHEWDMVRKTLIHECIHYALYELGKPYQDGHPYFEAELQKYGSHSTNTVHYKGKVEAYQCPSCGKVFKRKKKYPGNGKGYMHASCKTEIIYIGQKII